MDRPLNIPGKFFQVETNGKQKFLAIALTLFAVIHLARCVGAPSPLYGGDEYAYYISGLHRDRLWQLWTLDPYLQHEANNLFLGLIYLANKYTLQPAIVTKLVAVIFYVSVIAWLSLHIARRISVVRGVAFVVLAGLLPSSTYGISMMPETAFYSTAIVAVVSLAILGSRSLIIGAAVAGVLTSVALLIKPHAVAVLIGLVASLAMMTCAPPSVRFSGREASTAIVCYLVSVYCALLILGALLTGSVTLMVHQYVVGDFYAHIAISSVGANDNVLAIARFYVAAVTSVLLVLLPFAAACTLTAGAGYFRQPVSNIGDRTFYLGYFGILCVTAVTLAMVAIFSAGQTDPFELNRLHGRYFAHIYVLMIWLGLSIPDWSQIPGFKDRRSRWGRFLLASIWIGIIVLGPQLFWTFSLYPWDNPEMFPFYRVDLSTWKWPGATGWVWKVGLLSLLIPALALLFRRVPPLWPAISACAVFFLVGTLQTSRWQAEHLGSISPLTTTGEFARILLRDIPQDQILVVGPGRYGDMAFVLFGLSCQCRVYVPEKEEPLTKESVPSGVRYLVVVGPLIPPADSVVLFRTANVQLLRLL